MTSTASHVTHRTRSRSLAIGLLAIVLQSLGSAWGSELAKKPSKEASKLEALIDALANRNPRPRIVNLGVEDVPIFDKDYDWKEQARVLAAVDAVRKQAAPEMFEVLLAHETDDRYLLTFADEAENEFAFNWSIGDLCIQIVDAQLVFPVKRNLKVLEHASKRMPDDLGRLPDILPIPVGEAVEKRRKSPERKTFAELQIQVCQRALDDLPKVKDVPEKAKADFRARIESEIAQIKKIKQGVFQGFGEFRFPGERFDLFNAEKAGEIRQEYAKWNDEKAKDAAKRRKLKK